MLLFLGQIVAVENVVVGEKATATLYPRGPIFGVELIAPQAKQTASSSSSSSAATASGASAGASGEAGRGAASAGHAWAPSSGGGGGTAAALATSYDLGPELLRGEALCVFPGASSAASTTLPGAPPSSELPGVGPPPLAHRGPGQGFGQGSLGPGVPGVGFEVVRVCSERASGRGQLEPGGGEEKGVSASGSFAKLYSVSLEKALGAHNKNAVQWASPFDAGSVPVSRRPARRHGPSAASYSASGAATGQPWGRPEQLGSGVRLVRLGCTSDVAALWRSTGSSLNVMDEEKLRKEVQSGRPNQGL